MPPKKKFSLDRYKEIPPELRREFLVNHPRDAEFTQQLLSRVLAEVVAGVKIGSRDKFLTNHYDRLLEVLERADGEIVFNEADQPTPTYTAIFTDGTKFSHITVHDFGIGEAFGVNISTVVPEPYHFRTTFGLKGLSFA